MTKKQKNRLNTKVRRGHLKLNAVHVLSRNRNQELSENELRDLKLEIYGGLSRRACLSNPYRKQSVLKTAAALSIGADVDSLQVSHGTGLMGDIESVAGDISRVGRRITLAAQMQRYKEVG